MLHRISGAALVSAAHCEVARFESVKAQIVVGFGEIRVRLTPPRMRSASGDCELILSGDAVSTDWVLRRSARTFRYSSSAAPWLSLEQPQLGSGDSSTGGVGLQVAPEA